MNRRIAISLAMLSLSVMLLIGIRAHQGFAYALANAVARPVSLTLAQASGATPIPLAELITLFLLAACAFEFVRALAKRRIAVYLENIMVIISALALSYVVLWSSMINAPLIKANPNAEHTTSELSELCTELMIRANALSAMDLSSDVDYKNAKLARYPEALRRLGIAGVYVPWTGETIISGLESEFSMPFLVAHETAHQLGYAREDEANYIAYKTCAAGDARSQYSGAMYALYYSMDALHDADSQMWGHIYDRMNEAVQLDYYRLNGLRNADIPAIARAKDRAIAAFNQLSVGGAVRSYGDVVDLLLQFSL